MINPKSNQTLYSTVDDGLIVTFHHWVNAQSGQFAGTAFYNDDFIELSSYWNIYAFTEYEKYRPARMQHHLTLDQVELACKIIFGIVPENFQLTPDGVIYETH